MSVFDLHTQPILVGVDGSAASLAALRWAAGEAARTAAPLQVITTWPSYSRDAGAIETQEQARAVADLLGSVSRKVALYARVPVVVVPAARTGGSEPGAAAGEA